MDLHTTLQAHDQNIRRAERIRLLRGHRRARRRAFLQRLEAGSTPRRRKRARLA